jgi:voltage-gated potassium channel
LSELGRLRDKASWVSWRDTLLNVLRAWNRHNVPKILAAIVVIWIVSAIALHFAERGTNPAFETLGESLWNVWVTLFSGLEIELNSLVGRLVVSAVLVVGVALAGLFTASVASILIDRALRSREVTKLEMSDHLVLCNWSPRALDWIREVHSGIVTDQRPVVVVHDTPTKSCWLTNWMKPPSATSISSKATQPTK